jgi:hypothetical protein
MNIELHIDELVLHGFNSTDRMVIAAAVERTLMRLLVERGLPPTLQQSGALAQLDGGSFTVTPHRNPEAIGAQVARAIYEGLQE